MERISRQGAPSTIRCIETSASWSSCSFFLSQGAPSTIRCIETYIVLPFCFSTYKRQGAPSTIRCIETWLSSCCRGCPCQEVREHPAPSGALRPGSGAQAASLQEVREHPAPSGALRLGRPWCGDLRTLTRQGAPSTIRCIETESPRALVHQS